MKYSSFKKSNMLAVVVLAAVLVVSCVLFLQTAHSATLKLPENVSLILGVGTHGNLSSETTALMRGVRYYRTDISLNSIQANQIASENKQFGARYLGILDYETTAGIVANGTWNLSSWNESVLDALREYPEISAWEIWNEPLVPQFQTGYMNGSAYNYYQMIKNAYELIKSKEPNATVVCFGGAPIANYYAFEWYAQVWSYGASNYCDAVSLHAYADGATLLNRSNNSLYWTEGLSAYWNLTRKPIWITETGIPAHSYAYPSMYNQQVQNTFLIQDIRFFNNFSYVKSVYWYDLWGLSDGAQGNNFGLLNLSEPYLGKPNQAWNSFLLIYNNSASTR